MEKNKYISPHLSFIIMDAERSLAASGISGVNGVNGLSIGGITDDEGISEGNVKSGLCWDYIWD